MNDSGDYLKAHLHTDQHDEAGQLQLFAEGPDHVLLYSPGVSRHVPARCLISTGVRDLHNYTDCLRSNLRYLSDIIAQLGENKLTDKARSGAASLGRFDVL